MDFQLAPFDEKIIEELEFRKIDESHDYVEYLFTPTNTIRIGKRNRFTNKPMDEQIPMVFIGFFEDGICTEQLIIPPISNHQEIEIFKDLNFIDEFLIRFLGNEELAIMEKMAFDGMIKGSFNFDPSELKSSNQRSNFKPSILKYISDKNCYQFRCSMFCYSLARAYIQKTKSGYPKGILSQIKDLLFLFHVNWSRLVEHTAEYKLINKKHRKKLDELVKKAEYELAGAEIDAFEIKIKALAIRDWPNIERSLKSKEVN